jgi:hypothetical protein
MLFATLIFISYSRADAARAVELRAQLEAHGCSVAMDKTIRAGADWTKAIEDLIDSADVVAVLLGRSIPSLYVRAEYLHALDRGKRVIPVMVSDKARLPIPLQPLQRVSLKDAATRIECK